VYAAGKNSELAGFQLEHDGVCDAPVVACRRPDRFGELTDLGFDVLERHIALKSVLCRYRLCRHVGSDFTLLRPSRQLVEAHAVATKAVLERGQIHPSSIRDRSYPEATQLSCRDLADSRQTFHRQGQQERIHFPRLNDKEPVGLSPARGNLREELVRRPLTPSKCSSVRICSRIVRATCVAVGKPVLFSETST
jgi:hypothetical protein